jgi:hypothetical protein
LFNATTSELVKSILVHDERGDGRLDLTRFSGRVVVFI